jgi:hypothetical protein
MPDAYPVSPEGFSQRPYPLSSETTCVATVLCQVAAVSGGEFDWGGTSVKS